MARMSVSDRCGNLALGPAVFPANPGHGHPYQVRRRGRPQALCGMGLVYRRKPVNQSGD